MIGREIRLDVHLEVHLDVHLEILSLDFEVRPL